MFQSVTKTWNPFIGCDFGCDYCWARPLALTRLNHQARYQDGFAPKLVERELYRKLPASGFVAVSLMGDIAWAKEHELARILRVIAKRPCANFLLCTKDPSIYGSPVFRGTAANIYFGTTIESNRPYAGTQAPAPEDRYRELLNVFGRRFLSIEPVMDFDVPVMVAWLQTLCPSIIEIGADNHHHRLPEPDQDKLETLIYYAKKFCPDVRLKPGLERLMPDTWLIPSLKMDIPRSRTK